MMNLKVVYSDEFAGFHYFIFIDLQQQQKDKNKDTLANFSQK